MNLPRGYISYNQVKLYQICPQKYYYTYVEKIPAPINDKVFLGMVFHAVAEHFLKERIAGREQTKDSVLQVFDDKFLSLQDDYDIVWVMPSADVEKRGLAFVKHFLREIANAIDPLMVEEELEVELPGLGIKLKGIIDLVEKDFSITDFKTTTTKWTKEKINNSYLQMVIYKYLFEKSFGDVITQLKFRIVYAKGASNIRNQLVSRNA